MTDTSNLSLMRLWQLISPSLPVGSYAWSGGLESAVEEGYVDCEEQALEWIASVLQHAQGSLDVPLLKRLYKACQQQNSADFGCWNNYCLASRESAELHQEDIQLGRALRRLLIDLDVPMDVVDGNDDVAYASMFALACVYWQIKLEDAAQGLLWTWCENQVAAAIKLVPLGQTAGQKILLALQSPIIQCAHDGLNLADDKIGFTLPGLAILSARHETQYSRLFRS